MGGGGNLGMAWGQGAPIREGGVPLFWGAAQGWGAHGGALVLGLRSGPGHLRNRGGAPGLGCRTRLEAPCEGKGGGGPLVLGCT